MMFLYGKCNRNVVATSAVFHEIFPNRPQPFRALYIGLLPNFVERVRYAGKNITNGIVLLPANKTP